MKQRIRVVGIVQNEREVLIMKKSQGRVDGIPTWELPTGKIKFGEQPEEAIERTLEEYLGHQADQVARRGNFYGAARIKPAEQSLYSISDYAEC